MHRRSSGSFGMYVLPRKCKRPSRSLHSADRTERSCPFLNSATALATGSSGPEVRRCPRMSRSISRSSPTAVHLQGPELRTDQVEGGSCPRCLLCPNRGLISSRVHLPCPCFG